MSVLTYFLAVESSGFRVCLIRKHTDSKPDVFLPKSKHRVGY